MSDAYIAVIAVASTLAYIALGAVFYTIVEHVWDDDEAAVPAAIFWPVTAVILMIVAMVTYIHRRLKAWLEGPRVPRAVAREKEKR